MKKQPLVSINIPTYNSEKTIRDTLLCVGVQSYENIEVIIVDSFSDDKTLEIVKDFDVRVVMCEGKLLESRIAGARASKGDYVLLLDSDQILNTLAVEKAVEKMKHHDSLWLYERSYNKEKFLPSLYDADRILTQEYLKEGVVLPRFFKKEMLLKAMKKIPKRYIDIIGAQDHIIIDEEIKKLSKKMGMVSNAVQHIEPENLAALFKKQYRWGKTTRNLYDTGVYRELITKKNKFRRFYFNHPVLSTKSFILRMLRGVPYFVGFYVGGKK